MEKIVQRVLQGNARGPSIWIALSSVLFEILHKGGFRTKFKSALSKKILTLVGFAYVDDCDLIQVQDNSL